MHAHTHAHVYTHISDDRQAMCSTDTLEDCKVSPTGLGNVFAT